MSEKVIKISFTIILLIVLLYDTPWQHKPPLAIQTFERTPQIFHLAAFAVLYCSGIKTRKNNNEIQFYDRFQETKMFMCQMDDFCRIWY